MSEAEQLEQAFSNLIDRIKELENDSGQEAASDPEPSNEDPEPPATVESVMKANSKGMEMLCICEEFEMMVEDKIASMYVMSNELMLNALHLLEQKEQLMEIHKKAKDIHTKWLHSSETVVASFEALE